MTSWPHNNQLLEKSGSFLYSRDMFKLICLSCLLLAIHAAPVVSHGLKSFTHWHHVLFQTNADQSAVLNTVDPETLGVATMQH
jgi:hypothetical protein